MVSEKISGKHHRRRSCAARPRCSVGSSSGVSASVTAIARNRRTCTGTRVLEKPGISIRQPPMRQNRRKTGRTVSGPIGAHEMVPSDLISTPRAISTCESTGSVANSRSDDHAHVGPRIGRRDQHELWPWSMCPRIDLGGLRRRTARSGADRCRTRRRRPWRRASGSGGRRGPSGCRGAAPSATPPSARSPQICWAMRMRTCSASCSARRTCGAISAIASRIRCRLRIETRSASSSFSTACRPE